MKIIKTFIDDLVIIEPNVFEDDRGYFFESFNQERWEAEGFRNTFGQDNEALSSYGVIRGLHWQTGEYAQAKLVRVAKGAVLDVAVDLRPKSKTFGAHFTIQLNGENKRQLFVPRGFAHGYSVLKDNTIFSYKCDNFYHKEAEESINPLDTSLAIDWCIPIKDIQLSEKDMLNPSFTSFKERAI